MEPGRTLGASMWHSLQSHLPSQSAEVLSTSIPSPSQTRPMGLSGRKKPGHFVQRIAEMNVSFSVSSWQRSQTQRKSLL